MDLGIVLAVMVTVLACTQKATMGAGIPSKCSRLGEFYNQRSQRCDACISCNLLNRREEIPCGEFTNTQCGECLDRYEVDPYASFHIKRCRPMTVVAPPQLLTTTSTSTTTTMSTLTEPQHQLSTTVQDIPSLHRQFGIWPIVVIIPGVGFTVVSISLALCIYRKRSKRNEPSETGGLTKVISVQSSDCKDKEPLMTRILSSRESIVDGHVRSVRTTPRERPCHHEQRQQAHSGSDGKPLLESEAGQLDAGVKCIPASLHPHDLDQPRPRDDHHEQSVDLGAVPPPASGPCGSVNSPSSLVTATSSLHHASVPHDPTAKVHCATSTNDLDQACPRPDEKYDQAPVHIHNVTYIIEGNTVNTINNSGPTSRHQSDEHIGFSKEEEGNLTKACAEVGPLRCPSSNRRRHKSCPAISGDRKAITPSGRWRIPSDSGHMTVIDEFDQEPYVHQRPDVLRSMSRS